MATARWVSPAYSLACRNVDTPVCEPVFRPMPGACIPRKDTGPHTPGQRATIVEFRTAPVNDMIVRASSRRACEISNHDARLSPQVALLPDGLPASGIEISMPLACFKSQCLARLEQGTRLHSSTRFLHGIETRIRSGRQEVGRGTGRTSCKRLKMTRVHAGHFVGVQGFVVPLTSSCSATGSRCRAFSLLPHRWRRACS
jgi:hypothetical protein